MWHSDRIGVAGRYRLVRGLVPVALVRLGYGREMRWARRVAVALVSPCVVAYLAGYIEGVNHQAKHHY